MPGDDSARLPTKVGAREMLAVIISIPCGYLWVKVEITEGTYMLGTLYGEENRTKGKESRSKG